MTSGLLGAAPTSTPEDPRRRVHLAYLAPLDGLRAVAVLAVMTYHGQPSWLPGGFLGVDVFFVISGYLITTLLVRERTQLGTVDLPGFWLRRARRLLPAIVVVVAAVGVYALLLADSSVLERIRTDGLSALLYVNNWSQIAEGTSYFGINDPSPLRHTWSLAIEEQFYLVWPLLVLGALRLSRGRVALWAPVAALLALVSAALMAVLSSPGQDPTRAYYGTDTRAQALLVGAAAAFLLHGKVVRGRGAQALAAAGLLGLAGLVLMGVAVHDTDSWMYDGGFLLVAVLSVLVVMATTLPLRSMNLAGLALGLPVLAAVGRISYGLYLWHWPIDVAVTSSRTGLDGVPLFALRTAITFGVAALSYRFVERPIRAGARPPVQVVAGLAAGVLVTGVVVFAGTAGGGGPVPFGSEVGDGDRRVLVVGDSVAQGLAERLPESLQPEMTVHNGGLIGCGVTEGDPVQPPSLESPVARQLCPDRLRLWDEMVSSFDPDVSVIFTGGYEVFPTEIGGERLEPQTPAFGDFYQEALQEDIDVLSRGGGQVVLVTAHCMAERGVVGPGQPERNDIERVRWLNTQLQAVAARNPEVGVADLYGRVCPDGQHTEDLDGVELYRDGLHFSDDGAALVWDWLEPQLPGATG